MADVCYFDSVTVWIPKKKIRKFFWNHRYPSKREYAYLHSKSKEIEAAMQRLAHAKTLVDKILLRGYDEEGVGLTNDEALSNL